MAEHAFDEMDSANAVIDGMDDALAAEYESGRALRLMMKLAFINERPEFGVDTRWSESGDCYVLKLFRDFGKTSDGSIKNRIESIEIGRSSEICLFHVKRV